MFAQACCMFVCLCHTYSVCDKCNYVVFSTIQCVWKKCKQKYLPYYPSYKVMALFPVHLMAVQRNLYGLIMDKRPGPYNFQPTQFFKTPNVLVPKTRPRPYNRGNTVHKKEKKRYFRVAKVFLLYSSAIDLFGNIPSTRTNGHCGSAAVLAQLHCFGSHCDLHA